MLGRGSTVQRSNQQAPVSGDLDSAAVSSRSSLRGRSARSLERSQPWLIATLLLLGAAACGKDHKRPHSATNDTTDTTADDPSKLGGINAIPELAPQWKKLDLVKILRYPAAFLSVSRNKSLYETWGAQGAENHRQRGSLPRCRPRSWARACP